MEYRILGKTGLEVSALGIGTWQLSGPIYVDGKADGFPDIGAEQAQRLIAGCADLGINLIDSAEIYGTDGEGERRVGAALKGQRHHWVISTKFGVRCSSTGQRVTDCSPVTIRTSLEGSLRRLQTDYVDIYLYHSEPEPDLIAAGKAVLEQLKQEGKLRFYGISTDAPDILPQLTAQNAVDVVQFNQSLLTYPQAILEQVQTHQLGSIVRGAFAYGMLSGRYFHQRPQLSSQDIRHPWLNQLKTERYAAYERLLPAGFPMSAFALRYLLDFPTTHAIILGGKSLADYQACLRAFELPPLTEETKLELAKIRRYIEQPSLKQRVKAKIRQLLPMGSGSAR
jgi:aryl-alcohol dehydrogenase-like predicted oxidoreductase